MANPFPWTASTAGVDPANHHTRHENGGGDQVSIAGLLGLPSVAGSASGLATLNGSSLVVQNPANATATPTASKIVISNTAGTLDNWVTVSSTSQVESYAIKWALVTGG